jgi:flagellin-like protein
MKKGVSGIITTVVLIALALAIVAVVWVVVKNIVEGRVAHSEACFDVFEKVRINEIYTCWDSEANQFQFSISIGDIEVDEILIAIGSEAMQKSIRITSGGGTVEGVSNYRGDSNIIKTPGKNAGLTYIYSGTATKPDYIEIAPVVDGKQCDISDSLYEIESCY